MPPGWSTRRACRCPRTSNPASPPSRPTWRRRWGWPLPPGWPAARSRISPGTRTTPSTTPDWPRTGSTRRPRPPTAGPSTWCSPPGPRTTSTAGPTWPTPSPASRPIRRPAPTSSTPGLTDLDYIRAVVSSLDRPVNVWPGRGSRRWRSWPRPGSPGSRSGAFAFAAHGALLEAADEFLDAGTYGYWERAAVGAKVPPRRSRPAGPMVSGGERRRLLLREGRSARSTSGFRARWLGHHIHRPTSRFSAVTSTERTMMVSSSTPKATAKPSSATNTSGRMPGRRTYRPAQCPLR